jgi:uncharacterized protein (DUF952 family)
VQAKNTALLKIIQHVETVQYKVILLLYCTTLLVSYTSNANSNHGANDMRPRPGYLYKLLSKSQWESVQKNSFLARFCGELDKRDSYIHLSTASQAQYISNKYFKSVSDGVLLKIDYAKIKKYVKWEANSKEEIFPHVYGAIPMDAVIKVYEINMATFDFSVLEK